MFDILIRGGEVVTPYGCGDYDVGISGEKVVAVDLSGTLRAGDDTRVIDASGKIVMPGGIDPHVHCSWHIPAIEGVAAQLTAPPSQVSRAALYGGTTTMIDFAAWEEGETFEQTISRRDQDWRGRCHCDYAYHLMLRGGMPLELIDTLSEVIQAGYPTIKIFTTDITPSRRGRMVDFGYMWEVFQAMARCGGLGVIHAEDNDLVMHMYGRLFQEGRTSFENMAEVHSVLSEDLSFRRVLRLAENVEGTALYMMHISAATGVAAVEEARAKNLPVYGETLHQYMLYNQDDYRRPNGQIYHTYPSLKTEVRSTVSQRMSCAAGCRSRPKASVSMTPPVEILALNHVLRSCIRRWSLREAIHFRNMWTWSRVTRQRSWGYILVRGRSPLAVMPTLLCLTRTRPGSCAMKICMRPITHRGRVSGSVPGRC